MATKTGTLTPPRNDTDPAAEKLGCYRVWVRPKAARKETRKRGHMMLGPYSLSLGK